jgi:hypothetical protein
LDLKKTESGIKRALIIINQPICRVGIAYEKATT